MAVIAIGNSVLINTSFSGPSLGVGGTTSRRAFIKSGRTYVVNPKGKHQATIISMNGFGDNGSRLSEALSVRGDLDFRKDYSYSNVESSLSSTYSGGSLFPSENCKHWIVRVERPPTGVIERAPLVDYYCQILTTVMGNEMDAQMCIYHISLQSNYGFCCVLDDECAKELTSVPGVLSVQRDENVESNDKDYGATATNVKTKKLFVTGLSFYTSEKTLRAAFEGFGELVEVKIIMDKISKRSKGFAFVEYTTEAAASAALKEMNGKIINGWMIVVDVAKPNPPKYSRGAPRHGTR